MSDRGESDQAADGLESALAEAGGTRAVEACIAEGLSGWPGRVGWLMRLSLRLLMCVGMWWSMRLRVACWTNASCPEIFYRMST